MGLVIGNTNYPEVPLRNPGNDAKAIGAELQKFGFTVSLQLNAGRTQMVNAIQSFGGDLAKSKGVGLFYYAGHGAQLAWRNYLIPVDVAIDSLEDLRDKAVELNSLLQGLIAARNPMNVIILDACRDNPFGKKLVTEQKGLSQFDAPPGSLLAYATSPGNTAADGEGENGLYTENLLRELTVPEAKIEDVFKRVRLAVRRKSEGRQIPWESTSLEEDFYFQPPKQVRKLSKEELEQQFEQELAIWEKIKNSKELPSLEDYLRRFPSGKFSELIQFRLDRLLAQQEKPIQVALVAPAPAVVDADRKQQEEFARAEAELKKQQQLAQAEAERKRKEGIAQARERPTQAASAAPIMLASIPPNPYSKGTARANTDYKIGDSYTYRTLDTLTRMESVRFTETVTEVTDIEVIFNAGERIIDFLGNDIRSPMENYLTSTQFYSSEYFLGKKWTTRFRWKHIKGRGKRHMMVKDDVAELEFKVVAREKITVPAGTFDAFKIVGNGYGLGSGSNWKYVYWIAPDVARRPIAIEHLLSNPGAKTYQITDRHELVAYRQSD
ncbi:MAG TPA: caspase family protein [Burkholderiales bacterium]|nr:caspase family protein [Burkholderiales bacterium]